jgi:formimidoylglutamate deiminase
MYRVALRLSPAQLQAVAAQLYAELLCGGYTQVCEFHYLHHQPDGRPYDDPLAMAWALCDAAQQTGIGLTMLPVLYERAGFRQPTLREDQRRFATDADWVMRASETLQACGRARLNAGVAVHSLRAAAPESITAVARWAEGRHALPIHVHVAEQQQEVDDCLAATGKRPVDWLCHLVPLDARWQLVHATHVQPQEIEAVAARGAGVVVCPGTEANLGDGFTDVPGWLQAGVPLALGSDSHVTRAWSEELRWLEYGQRLRLQARNIAAAPAQGTPATAARLFERVLPGGAAAAGFQAWGLVPGARADLLVLDPQDDALLGVPAERVLDAFVFSSPGRAIREVYVAGEQVVADGRHRDDARLRGAFAEAMAALWHDAA